MVFLGIHNSVSVCSLSSPGETLAINHLWEISEGDACMAKLILDIYNLVPRATSISSLVYWYLDVNVSAIRIVKKRTKETRNEFVVRVLESELFSSYRLRRVLYRHGNNNHTIHIFVATYQISAVRSMRIRRKAKRSKRRRCAVSGTRCISNDALRTIAEYGIGSEVASPNRCRRHWRWMRRSSGSVY